MGKFRGKSERSSKRDVRDEVENKSPTEWTGPLPVLAVPRKRMAAVHAECCSIGDEEKLLRNRCVRVRVVYTGKGRGITGVFYPPGQNMNKEEGNGYPRFFSSPHYY